jgi:hypothetical protein
MQPVFVHERLDPGQVGDLMDQGRRILAVQRMAAPTTGPGPTIGGRAELLGRDQGAERLAMAGLSATFAPRRRSRRLSFQADRVGRGRLGGIRRVESEPGLEIAHGGFQLGDLIPEHFPGIEEGGLRVLGHDAPERLRDRKLLTHIR